MLKRRQDLVKLGRNVREAEEAALAVHGRQKELLAAMSSIGRPLPHDCSKTLAMTLTLNLALTLTLNLALTVTHNHTLTLLSTIGRHD